MPAHHPRPVPGPVEGTAPRARASAVALALVLALAMVLGGCGGKAAEKKPDAKPGTSEEPSASAEAAPDPGYGAPKVGECHRMTAEQSVASVSTSRSVGCSRPHTSVVAYIGYLRIPITPKSPLKQRQVLGTKLCEPAYRRIVGGTLADRATSILTWTLFTPGQAQLERGARWVRCDVVARSGAKLMRLPAGTPLLNHGVPEQLRVCQSATGTDVSCSQPHAFKVAGVYRLVGPNYPNIGRYTAAARARCNQLTGAQGGYWQPPSRVGWKSGDHFIRCLVREPEPSASPSP